MAKVFTISNYAVPENTAQKEAVSLGIEHFLQQWNSSTSTFRRNQPSSFRATLYEMNPISNGERNYTRIDISNVKQPLDGEWDRFRLRTDAQINFPTLSTAQVFIPNDAFYDQARTVPWNSIARILLVVVTLILVAIIVHPSVAIDIMLRRK